MRSDSKDSPEQIFNRVIKDCENWTWERVFAPPEEVKPKNLKPKLKPIDVRTSYLEINLN